MIFKFILIFTSLAFLFYGFNCLRSQFMFSEFERFGLSKTQRHITGVLQIVGAFGLLLGLFLSVIGLIAALGLSLLMLLGFIVRIKIKDSFFQSLPSFIFILINLYLSYQFLQLV